MAKHLDDRRRLLDALLDFASNSGTSNPHFYRKEMMELLGISEGEFNIIQKSLGDRYCTFVDSHNDDNRYAINVSECQALRSQFKQEDIQEQRHRQTIRIIVLAAILTAVLTIALTRWLI
jgi:hypothetical protein